MCGICGEFKFNGKSFNDVKLTNLMSSISNRGRDSKGTFKNADIFLGHHRLSIIDTTDKSNQPMVIENHVIVFNGIIYNYKDIRRKLITKGHIFKSTGDTEVVIRSYIEYGDKCVEHFDGVFSFCIYNLIKKNIFLARDRIGIKPLYYSINGSQLVFSSSMKGILSNKDKIEINPIALNYQFTIHSMVPAPHTIIDGINKLEPGHILNVTKSGETLLKKYFDVNNVELKNYNDNEIINNIDALLNNAVEKRLNIADVPVGILLSGGLDSSLITAISKKYKEELNTYSIGFNTINDEIGNEFYFSDLVSDDFNTTHEKYNISDNDLYHNLDTVISNMSEPMVSQDSSAFFLLAKNVSLSNKVVLSGQGADEVFGGYFWYEQIMKDQGRNDTEILSKYYFDRTFDNYCNAINKNYISTNNVFNEINNKFKEMDQDLPVLDKVLRLELSTLIIDDPVKRVDNMTMSHALEARVPFLDIDLIKFMLSVKSEKKINKTNKYYLKKLSERYLKNEVIYRDKFYFPVPPLKIIKDRFYDYCKNVLCSDAAMERNIYNRKYIDKLIASPNDNFTNLNGNELWHFTLLERWLQLNVDV
jgi:asparagine synthase (glutamine-hydrolysing)